MSIDPDSINIAARGNDCRRFQGTYADRDEAPGQTARPSLTREFFGADSPWEKVSSIRFDFTAEDAVDVTLAGESLEPMVRRFSAKAGEFRCDQGKLVLHTRRWMYSDLTSGRENRDDRPARRRAVSSHACPGVDDRCDVPGGTALRRKRAIVPLPAAQALSRP